jgi:hypothetical protein
MLRGFNLAATGPPHLLHPRQDVGLVVLGDDLDDVPPQRLKPAELALVFHVPPAVGAVIVAVVLENELKVPPTHVGDTDQASLVVDGNLRLGRGIARIDEQQPKPGLPR